MKRLLCLLLILSLLLTGCGHNTVAPNSENRTGETGTPATAAPTDTPLPETPVDTPAGTSAPATVLSTFAPKAAQEALFMEELLSHDGEPVYTPIHALLSSGKLTKAEFFDRFSDIIHKIEALDKSVRLLSDSGRTMTADRKAKTTEALSRLTSEDMLTALETAYGNLPGEGETLPLSSFSKAMAALVQDIGATEDRTQPFFSLDKDGAREYRVVLSRYMGESVDPNTILSYLEDLAQTEAYALYTALQADPEAARKKEPISCGSFTRDLSRLRDITQRHFPIPDGIALSIPYGTEADRERDLLQLAFRFYPGMEYLKLYADQTEEGQRARWANGPEGYLAGLAVHNCYAVIRYLDDFELEYVQYRWNEDMLYVTFTSICSLLIHYYGYTQEDLSAYLQRWGAEDFTQELYDKAMFDPFESLVAAYGYCQYLDICQASLDAGCESEEQFFADYMAAGPAPFDELKEYMVSLYQNKVDKAAPGE